MSGVYIPNMKMPKGCGECFALGFRIKEGNMVDYCLRLDKEIPLYNLDEVRMNDCPIKEVPPHDDLISRKALYEAMREHFGCDCCDKACTSDCEYMGSDFYLVWNAPTVIEASK